MGPPASCFSLHFFPSSLIVLSECLCLVCTGVPVPLPLAFCDLTYLRHQGGFFETSPNDSGSLAIGFFNTSGSISIGQAGLSGSINIGNSNVLSNQILAIKRPMTINYLPSASYSILLGSQSVSSYVFTSSSK